MRRAVLATVLTLSLMGAGGLTARTAEAVSTAAPGAIGHDISHPQCVRDALPAGGAFGIVGVNKGRTFTANPCLEQQWDWANDRPYSAGVYINTGNPGPKSANYWTRTGTKDPALCVDAKSAKDPGCAYNYGWHAAEYAMKVARKAGVSKSRTWWLDVETANSWEGNGVANAADLQGAFDYLREHGVKEVGIYSTDYQWRTITGGYHASTAATYKLAWAGAFKPKHRMYVAPLWQAGVAGIEVARERCGISFTGASIRMAQFIVDDLDHNLMCGSASASSDPCRAGAPIPAGRTPIFGTNGDDRIKGTGKDEIIYAGPGADIVDGGGGADILCGGSGKDDLRGGTGADVLYGGSSADILRGGSGNDRLYGGDGDDRLYGGSWGDKLYGQNGSDFLDGGSASDTCSGGAGKDKPYRNC